MFKEKCKKVASALVVPATVLVSSGSAFAAEGDVSSAVVTALQTTASSITGTLNQVAPIGLGIAGTFLVWRYGMRFFKSLSK